MPITGPTSSLLTRLWKLLRPSRGSPLMAKDPGAQSTPLVVVCGATGTGKSKLGIELAEKFGGEVINSDSLQLYRGLDVVTNKVTAAEMKGVPHHLLGVLDSHDCSNTVHKFLELAQPLIHRLRSSSKVPFVVGGTFYYIEALLWEFLVEAPVVDDSTRYSSLSNSQVHAQLRLLDPLSAARLHPNDRRKVERALDVVTTTGIPLTTHITNQHQQAGTSKAGAVRYPGSLIIQLHCDLETLTTRLDQRTESMLEAGLITELDSYLTGLEDHPHLKFTKGLLQSIGFKEFHEFLLLSPADRLSTTGRDLYTNCVDQLKRANRRYAKDQIKWLNNRFLRRPLAEYIPVFQLDASDLSRWDSDVLSRAVMIVEDSIRGGRRIDPLLPLEVRNSSSAKTPLVCETCDNQVFVCVEQWRIHINSRRHHKRLVGAKRRVGLKEVSEH